MAGLMYEVGVNYPETELEIIPGVTAATGGAAVLGAPLIHDFCLISLSDLLTPWEKIEARLLAAAQADHGNSLAFFCLFKGKDTAVHFLFHWCSHKFFSRKIFLHQVYIYGISDDRITFIHGADRFSCHLVISSRSDSDYIYFTQNVSSILWQPLLWSHHFLLFFSAAACHFHWQGLHFSHRHCPHL